MEESNGIKERSVNSDGGSDRQPVNSTVQEKTTFQKLWTVAVCGAGLFSDGYVNCVIGSVSTILARIYGDEFRHSYAQKVVASITFAGTVLGMVVFGYLSDKWSRKNSLLVSTVILAVFAAVSAGSYGYNGSNDGMFAALAAYRFLVGIGIGGEYPCGSVACAESTGEMKEKTRNRWFIIFTNVMINLGFVLGAFIPFLCVLATGENRLRIAWRVMLGVGAIFPVILILMRSKLEEPKEFSKESMKHAKIPYMLVMKFYWRRLVVVSLIWFMYNFGVYSFGIYSSTIIANIFNSEVAPMSKILGWNTVMNLFYLPGSIFGSFLSDWVGPRSALAIGTGTQAAVGFLLAGLFPILALPNNVAPFVIVFGIYMTLGEMGPGDNIGLLASKTCATGVRGQYYAVAAATGKIGAFVGTFVFPLIEKAGGADKVASAQYPFYVTASLSVVATFLALFCLPYVGQDTIAEEDFKFRAYLEANNWDTAQLGLKKDTGEPALEN